MDGNGQKEDKSFSSRVEGDEGDEPQMWQVNLKYGFTNEQMHWSYADANGQNASSVAEEHFQSNWTEVECHFVIFGKSILKAQFAV